VTSGFLNGSSRGSVCPAAPRLFFDTLIPVGKEVIRVMSSPPESSPPVRPGPHWILFFLNFRFAAFRFTCVRGDPQGPRVERIFRSVAVFLFLIIPFFFFLREPPDLISFPFPDYIRDSLFPAMLRTFLSLICIFSPHSANRLKPLSFAGIASVSRLLLYLFPL